VHYLLCEGQRLEVVRLTAGDGRVLWQKRFPQGTTRSVFHVPRLAGAIVSGPDGDPAMRLEPVPAQGIRRGDGERVTAAGFAGGRDSYCKGAARQRAAALAIGFVFLGLLALFLVRWVRAKQTRDPYQRPWK
jgi:hypothetical protein